MDILIERHLENVEIPANLRINDQIKIYKKRCEEMGCLRPYHHFSVRLSYVDYDGDEVLKAWQKHK